MNDSGHGSLGSYASSIRDASNNGANIIFLGALIDFDAIVVQAAIQFAHSEGSLLIAPVGNMTSTVAYPAAYPAVMAVAATTISNTHLPSSNIGSSIEIAAPGGDEQNGILSTWAEQAECLSTADVELSVPPETYCEYIGTQSFSGSSHRGRCVNLEYSA